MYNYIYEEEQEPPRFTYTILTLLLKEKRLTFHHFQLFDMFLSIIVLPQVFWLFASISMGYTLSFTESDGTVWYHVLVEAFLG